MKSINKSLIIIFSIICISKTSLAQPSEIFKKKHQLNQLQVKIKQLETKLKKSNHRNKLLENELSKTNTEIASLYNKTNNIQAKINTKEQEIAELTTEITQLNNKLSTTQQQIAQYLTAHYKTYDITQLKLILAQKNLQKTENLLIYYKYLIAANQKLLKNFRLDQATLKTKNIQLNQELQNLQILHQKSTQYLQKLNNNKKYQLAVIKKLSLDINKNQKTLHDYRQNEINLSKLINNLTKQSVLQTKNSVVQMRGKLPKPLQIDASQIKKFRQGLVFYAPEGQEVQAISPGKVVFADWLNGYGLLMIIDHGWGVMSLYGNNLQLLKHVGDNVNIGDKISKIGHSGVLPENGLYFEIRHHGKAMPPEKWLH